MTNLHRLFLFVVVGWAFAVHATSYIWTGDAGDSKWTTPGNWRVGETAASEAPGSAAGDAVTFPALVVSEPIVIDLTDMVKIKTVTFDAGATAYQLGAASSQYLKLESGSKVTVSSSTTADQKILCLQTTAGGTIQLQNDATAAKFTFGDLRKVSNSGNPAYELYGAGTIEMDGSTAFDQVAVVRLYNTGDFILGDKSISTGSRISQLTSLVVSGHAGETHEVYLPEGRYLNTTGGSWNSVSFEAQENTRVYGPGIVVARYHFNCNTKAAQEYAGSFKVSSGKTLKIESYICRSSSYGMQPWGGPGVFGAGTLYLCSSNNLPGDARIQETGGTLAVDKIGLKGCRPDESNLGTGNGIRFMADGTLEYRGATDETTDRDLIVSNNSKVVTMTLANAGGGVLTWRGEAKQMYAASENPGARLRLNAKTNPIVFDGNFEAGKVWGLDIVGEMGVRFAKDLGTVLPDMPVTLAGGRLVLSNDVAFSSRLQVSSPSTLAVAENCNLTLESIPAIVDGAASLDIVLPETSTLAVKGKSATRLDKITVNGAAAALDASGKFVPDGRTYGTATWTSVTAGGAWSSPANWQDGQLPGEFDSVVVANVDSASPTYTITMDQPTTLEGLRSQTTASGKQTISGSATLTLAADGYVAVTNTTNARNHDGFDGGPFNFDVPLHLAASQRWLLGSARGWGARDGNSVRYFTKDISSEPDVDWQILGYGRYFFSSGSSANFKGSAKVGTFVTFDGTNQFSRLGTNGITLVNRVLTDDAAVNAGTTRMSPGLTYRFKAGEREATVTTPIALDVTSAVSSSRGGWSMYLAPICLELASGTDYGEPHVLTLTGGLSGSVSGSSDALAFAQSNSACQPAGSASYNFYPDDQRIVLAGDGSGLSGNSIENFTMLELAHPNAIGRGNVRNVICGYDGYWGSQCFSTIQGVTLRPGLSMSGQVVGSYSSDQNGAQYRIAYMQVGSAATPAAEGATTATFTGAIAEQTTCGFRLRLSAAAGTEARFTGKITTLLPLVHPYGEHPDIVGPGDVTLVNTGNSFATNLCVRAGRLVLEANGAAGSKPIWLGGFVPTLGETKEVRCVDANSSFSCTVGDVTVGDVKVLGKRLTVTGRTTPPTIDGVTVESGDYVLVNRPALTTANGLWKVTENPLVWERPDELDDADDLVGKVGLRLKVKEGVRFGGKSFMLARNPCYWRKSVHFSAGDEHFNGSANVPVFHPEPAAEPDAAVLTGADGLTLTCGIDVTDNASSGASAIGSKIEGSTTGFSGAIRLAKSVTLAAAKNSTVSFTGTFSGAGDIIGGGAGTSDVTGATVSIDATNGFAFASGTLRATAAQLADRPLAWRRTVLEDDTETTGVLAVEGDLDFTAHTLDFSSFKLSKAAGDDRKTPRKWAIATATGTVTLPVASALPAGWSLTVEDGTVYANYFPLGMVLIFR